MLKMHFSHVPSLPQAHFRRGKKTGGDARCHREPALVPPFVVHLRCHPPRQSIGPRLDGGFEHPAAHGERNDEIMSANAVFDLAHVTLRAHFFVAGDRHPIFTAWN